MDAATFRALGHDLVDQLAESLETLNRGPSLATRHPACIVNFHTTQGDVEEMVDIAARTGREVHAALSAIR
jgi:hypothetical protein